MATTVSLAANAFVTKEEAREFVFSRAGATEVSDEDQDILYRIVNAVCSAIERHTGKYIIIRSGIIQYDDGGNIDIVLRYYPVTEITSVMQNGSTLSSSEYHLYDDVGVLRKASGVWYNDYRANKVTYKAGYGTQTIAGGEVTAITGVPEDLRQAALEWIRAIWKSGPENFSAQITGGVILREDKIPARALGLLEPFCGIPVR